MTSYHLIRKGEHVVDSVFMHDNFNRSAAGAGESAMVVVTDRKVYTVGEDDDDESSIEDEGEVTPRLGRF